MVKLQIASILVSFSNSYNYDMHANGGQEMLRIKTYISESIYLSLNTRLQHTMKIIKVIFSRQLLVDDNLLTAARNIPIESFARDKNSTQNSVSHHHATSL